MTSKLLQSSEISTWIDELGLERYSRTVTKAIERGQTSTTKPGQILMDTAINRFSQYLQEWVESAQFRAGPQHGMLRFISLLKPEVISLLVSQIIIDSITTTNPLQGIALQIANALEEEVRFNEIRKIMPDEWKKLKRRYNFSHEGHKRKVIKAAVNRLNQEFVSWQLSEKYQLGFLLIDFFVASTGFVEIVSPFNNDTGKRKSKLKPTEEVLKWITETNDSFKSKYPFYLPLVEPPEDWVNPKEGGYPANILMRWPLVHQYNKKAPKLEYKEMPEVYDAVNSLQRVGWRVNDFTFAVFDYYWRRGEEVADIPGGNLKTLPEKPVDIKTNSEARKSWKKHACAVYNSNVKLATKKILYGKIHFVARHYQYQDFWFPYKLDFRGRAYPIPAFLNPQGCPLAKGLLKFAEGKPITTDEARGWFYIHGANTWGLDKETYENRVEWVRSNHAWLLSIAADPLSNRGWEEADSPWQFLAWCEEYANYKEDPEGFISYLPVAMDGTNNGLQIYSLLLRDPIGAEATNVSPSDKPRDIYQDVADDVTLQLNFDKNGYACDWLNFLGGNLPRKATKRPVMVTPYSGTPYSIRQYVEDWYEDLIDEKNLENNRPFPTTFNHTKYLTDLIINAINSRLVGAKQAMDWLHKVADLCTAHKIAIQWRTPSGFAVYQRVPNVSKITIRTQLGKIHRSRIVSIPNELTISKRGQSNGLAPNFIHSLDASIMTLVTNKMVKAGVTNLCMIHDSFATHAADCPKLSEVLRETVSEMFSGRDLLEEFRGQIQRLLGPTVDVPEVPQRGTLDPKCVLESKYIFG